MSATEGKFPTAAELGVAGDRPRVSLDVGEMTDMQLVRELGRMHWELIDRLSSHYLYGAGFPEAGDGDDEPQPARLDQGLLLAARLDEMTRQFRDGGIPHPDGEHWFVGLDHFGDLIRTWTTRLDQAEEGGTS